MTEWLNDRKMEILASSIGSICLIGIILIVGLTNG